MFVPFTSAFWGCNTKRHMRHCAYPNSGPCNTWFSEERRKANTKNTYLFACIQTNIIEGIIFAQLDWYWASQCFFRVFNSPLDPRLESIEWRSFEHTNFYLERCLLSFFVEICLSWFWKRYTKVVNVFFSYLLYALPPSPHPHPPTQITHPPLSTIPCRTSAHYSTPRDKSSNSGQRSKTPKSCDSKTKVVITFLKLKKSRKRGII